MMWYGQHMNGWGWTFIGVGMVLFCVVVITGVVLLLRYFGDTKRSSRDEDEMTSARYCRNGSREARSAKKN